MAYQAIIAKASQMYCWPSWIIYDKAFRQEMVGAKGQSWAKVDPSTYSCLFLRPEHECRELVYHVSVTGQHFSSVPSKNSQEAGVARRLAEAQPGDMPEI